MRTLTILVALLFPVLAQAHGNPEKTLPWDFFKPWKPAIEASVSPVYVVNENEDFYRLLNGEFIEGEKPLWKVNLVNRDDENESVDIIFIKNDRTLLLAQYYYRTGAGLTTYLYCMNTNREEVPTWYLVPPELFPYGEGSRRANIEELGRYLFTEHFMRYVVYTAYPSKASQ